MNKLSETASKVELGVSGQNTYSGLPYADEFLIDLRGNKAIQKYREMRDNNATIGAVMYAVEQTLRDVEIKVVPADNSPEALDAADFMQSVLDDMDHSIDDHISEALSFLTYGFSWFETVYKVRGGDARSPKKNSKYNDGKIGIKHLLQAIILFFVRKHEDQLKFAPTFMKLVVCDQEVFSEEFVIKWFNRKGKLDKGCALYDRKAEKVFRGAIEAFIKWLE
jgi:hypothetical protein